MAKTANPTPPANPVLLLVKDNLETKSARFKRLANMRAKKVISALRQLSLLGDQNRYERTEPEIAKLEQTILAELRAAIISLRSGKSDVGDIL